MKLKFYGLMALLLMCFSFYSQTTTDFICLGDDTTVCAGQQVEIFNCAGAGSGSSSSGGGLFLPSPTNVSLIDDVWSAVVPIGFNFSFYNNSYSQCVIGSNGLISFDLTKANQYCSWSFTGITPLPNTTFADPKTTAMVCYQDMNPSLGGQIQYQTVGTAPNRIFVVLYKEIPTFSCGECSYMTIMLYESSNNLEFHIGNKPPCTTWNSGLAIQGTENPAGTIAHITPGRNISQWSANQECKRFTPTSPTNTNGYTITNEEYILVTSVGTAIMWGNTNGQTFPYNNGSLLVTVPAGTTGYFLTGTACGTGIGSVSDTSWLTGLTSSVSATPTPDFCSAGVGTVTATANSGVAPFSFTWSNGASGTIIENLNAGFYSVTMTDALGCSSSASAVVGDTPASYTVTSTLVSCPGESNGSATAVMTPQLGNVTYLWDDASAQTSQTATGLSAGTYNCTVTSDIGCSGTVTVTINTIPAMVVSAATISDVTCNSGSDGTISVSVAQGTGTPPFSYSWDNSSSTTNTASDLSAGAQKVTVTDANNCLTTFTVIIEQPDPLQITFITSSTQICPEDDIPLQVTGIGGSSPYIFTWYENGNIIGTGTAINVDPDFTNTQYCVTLSEICGSPTTDTCTVITFPTPIIPQMDPDKLKDCVPATFVFQNNSNNSNEIATTYYQFSDGNAYSVSGSESVTNTFVDPAYYACEMTVTSIYGCVYTGLFQNIIEAMPVPNAEFTFTDNPATIFETTIGMQDQSTGDIASWQWISPGSIPTSSSAQNPSFTFPVGEVGQYPVTLIVSSDFGCTDTVSYDMNIVQDVIFFAPNAFTPDGDEFNQSWKMYIQGIDVYNFEFYIFNRWGEIIWESRDPDSSWDGTYNNQKVKAGTYVWKATAKDLINDNKYEFSGHINVLR